MKIGPRWNENVPSRRDQHQRAEDVARASRSGVNCTRVNADVEHARQRLRQRRLADPGHVLDEHVAARQQRQEQQLDRLGFAADDATHRGADAAEKLAVTLHGAGFEGGGRNPERGHDAQRITRNSNPDGAVSTGVPSPRARTLDAPEGPEHGLRGGRTGQLDRDRRRRAGALYKDTLGCLLSLGCGRASISGNEGRHLAPRFGGHRLALRRRSRRAAWRRGGRREDLSPAAREARGMSSVSSHVLDTALGRPAQKLRLRLQILELVEGSQHWTTLVETVTDDHGRVPSFSPDTALRAGTYRLCFDTKTYFEGDGRPVFFPQVDVVFAVEGAAEQNYHVPLLLSPFGYSTYRGG